MQLIPASYENKSRMVLEILRPNLLSDKRFRYCDQVGGMKLRTRYALNCLIRMEMSPEIVAVDHGIALLLEWRGFEE